MMKSLKAALAIVATTVLVACGSDGGSTVTPQPPQPPKAPVPYGVWTGTNDNGADVLAVVMEDGFAHFLYYYDEQNAGWATLTYNVSNQNIKSVKAVEFNNGGILNPEVVGVFKERDTLSGYVQYPGTRLPVYNFVTKYRADMDNPASLKDIASKFETAAVAVVSIKDKALILDEYALLTITSAGKVYIKGVQSRCEIQGDAVPDTSRQILTLALLFGENCGDLKGAPIDGTMVYYVEDKSKALVVAMFLGNNPSANLHGLVVAGNP